MATFFSSKELAKGQARDSAIAIHLKKIEQLITVNLYRLELHDLHENISPELCNQLLYNTHKKSEKIISKLDLLQAFISHEHQATTARLSYFNDKRGQPTLHIHTTKQQVHLIYEALHSLESSPLRVHFFHNTIYHALPPEAREYLATADSPQERLDIKQAANKLLRDLHKPRPSTKQQKPPKQQAPQTVTAPSYASAVRQTNNAPPSVTPDRRIQDLENTIATLTKQLEAQSTYISALNNSIEKLQVQLAQSAHPTAHSAGKDDDDVSMMGLDAFYDKLGDLFKEQEDMIFNCIKWRAEGINGNIQKALNHVEKFSPLQNDRHTKEWAVYLASIILTLIHEPDSTLPKEVRSKLRMVFPYHDTENSPEPQPVPPPPPTCSLNTTSTPETIDLTQNASTPTKQPSPTSSPSPASSPAPTSAPTSTALVPLPKASDTYMSSNTTTSKRPASPSLLTLPNMKTKGAPRKNRAVVDEFFAKRPRAKLTKSANPSADLAN